MRESEPNNLMENKRMQLVERIAEEMGQLDGLDPKSEQAKTLHRSIGHLQAQLDEIEASMGFGKRAA